MICPEQLAGLPTPRDPCEIRVDAAGTRTVVSQQGEDLTQTFQKAADLTLALCKTLKIEKAILKSKSPSCGYGCVYDGSFSGKTRPGMGVTAELLEKHGITVVSED